MSFSKVLVPTDFSPNARAALEHARTIAERFGSQLELLHAWELPPMGIPEWAVLAAGAPPMPVRDFIRNQAVQQMELLTGELRRAGVIAHGRVEEGEPARVILRVAEQERFDLIVMATHGRTGVERLFVGSVAEKVIRSAPCPVLVVRPQPEVGARVP